MKGTHGTSKYYLKKVLKGKQRECHPPTPTHPKRHSIIKSGLILTSYIQVNSLSDGFLVLSAPEHTTNVFDNNADNKPVGWTHGECV